MPKRQLRRTFEDKGFKGRSIHGDRKRRRLDEEVDLVELGKEFSTLRLVGPVVPYAMWWITIKTQQGKEVSIPKIPLGFDTETGDLREDVEDPYAEIEGARLQVFYLVNAIDRSVQEAEPRNRPKPSESEDETGFKEKGSPTWTPVRVLRMPPMVARQLQRLETTNKWKVKSKDGRTSYRTYDLTHIKRGRDVFLSKDKDANSPSDMYNLSLADKSSVTEEEMDYLIWDIEGLAKPGGVFDPESIEEARREAASLSGKKIESDQDAAQAAKDDLEEDFLEEDDGDLDELPWDGDDDDGEEPEPKAKPKADKGRKRAKAKDGPKSGKEALKNRLKRRKLRSQKEA